MKKNEWWACQGSSLRPLSCEGNAAPLGYTDKQLNSHSALYQRLSENIFEPYIYTGCDRIATSGLA